jgi:alpha-amylase/alpha-mannosidase (GH57 family)
MTRGRLAIHAHFYQPERRDPFGGPVRADPTAAPYATWTDRIIAECYRPNARLGNLDRVSYNVGPTLTAALAERDPETLARIAGRHAENAFAQGFHHAILPLASARDRRTEIRWGLRDHEVRFGRAATGFWLPETGVDVATLRMLAEEGVRHTVLAPWQAAGPGVEPRRPHRVDLGDGHSLVVAFYDTGLSAAVSFQPEVTADADRFARDWVLPRTSAPLHHDGSSSWLAGPPLVVIASDGELYGHHQPFRDLFLQRLVDPAVDRGFDVVPLGDALAGIDREALPRVQVVDRTSWSCHHGLLRWSAECPCVADGRWKQPLRSALERLAGAIDAVTEQRLATTDAWAARDDYVDVVLGRETAESFSARRLGAGAPAIVRRELETLMEAQRWRLAMFASCGWFWEDPVRPETRQVLRSAARAARLVDGTVGGPLERRLVEDLALLASPERGVDGATIYREALAEVGQPAG